MPAFSTSHTVAVNIRKIVLFNFMAAILLYMSSDNYSVVVVVGVVGFTSEEKLLSGGLGVQAKTEDMFFSSQLLIRFMICLLTHGEVE